MEINIQALARGKCNRSIWRLSAGVMGKQYHGFLGGLQRIIESRALRDKQSCKGKEYSVRPTAFQSPDCAPPRRITI
jgi:hypothetical protein